MQTVEAQPATVLPRMASTTAQIMNARPIRLKTTPKVVIRVIGFTDRLVMPLKASASIFRSG